jgi:ribosomal protein S18 acetylase RimI-like enzyme
MRIVELRRTKDHRKLSYSYKTRSHYALTTKRTKRGWQFTLALTRLPRLVKKSCESELFSPFVLANEEPRAFAAKIGNREVGWMEIALRSFKDRARIWELLVLDEFQGQGIGTALMKKAEEVARQKGLRMIVLETQSCNVKAIRFYHSMGYELVGFGANTYSNRDIERGEIRLDFGIELQ